MKNYTTNIKYRISEALVDDSYSDFSAEERKELNNFKDTKLMQLAAGSVLAMVPLCLAALFGATTRNVPFLEIRVAVRCVAILGLGLGLLALWSIRHEQTKVSSSLPALVSVWLTLVLAVVCQFVAASQERAMMLAQHFPNIEPLEFSSKARAITSALGASNFGLIGALGFAMLAMSSLPVSGKVRLVYFVLFQGLLIYSISPRTEQQFFLTLSVALTSLGMLYGLLRYRNIVIDGKRALQSRQLKEREAVLEYEHELDLAASIHQALEPPKRWKSTTRVEVQSFKSALHKVGGEWLAIRETKQGDLIFAIASVEGSGLHAALVAHSIASIWSVGEENEEFDAQYFLRRVNSAMHILGKNQKHVASMALVHISEGQLTYCSAGHGPLHLVGQSVTTLESHGTKLGIAAELVVESSTTKLSPTEQTDIIVGGGQVWDSLTRSESETIALLEQLRRHGVEVIQRSQTKEDVSMIWAHYDPSIMSTHRNARRVK